jgi:hypothetical protein
MDQRPAPVCNRLPMTLLRALRVRILLRDYFCLAIPLDHHEAGGIGPIRSARLHHDPTPYPISARKFARRAHVGFSRGRDSVILGAVRNIVHIPNVVFRLVEGEPVLPEVAAVSEPMKPRRPRRRSSSKFSKQRQSSFIRTIGSRSEENESEAAAEKRRRFEMEGLQVEFGRKALDPLLPTTSRGEPNFPRPQILEIAHGTPP